MAGPYREGGALPHMHPLRHPITSEEDGYAYAHGDEEEGDGSEVVRLYAGADVAIDEQGERTPFYSHHNNSYYASNTHHHRNLDDNLSETDLPLYRSRSQSLSMAQQQQQQQQEEEKPPALPEPSAGGYDLYSRNSSSGHHVQRDAGAPANFSFSTAAPLPTVRAVDYTNAASYRDAYPPSTGGARRSNGSSKAEDTNSSNNNHSVSNGSAASAAAANAGNTSTWSSNANTLTNSTSTNPHTISNNNNGNGGEKKRIDWAQDVAKVFDGDTGTTRSLNDAKKLHFEGGDGDTPQQLPGAGDIAGGGGAAGGARPSLSRASTENDIDDQNAFDDYDWDDDDELVKQLDEKYEEEYKKAHATSDGRPQRRAAVVRRFSPVHLGKLLLFTFLGNVIIVLLLITPALVLQLLVKDKTDSDHLRFVCDNVQAWCYWIAFNFIAKWIIHGLFDLIPKLFVFVAELIWGDLNERFIGYVEMFNANAPYVKPLFFAGFFWGSFAITFNSIFDLRNASDPSNSRAAYTWRVYQVVQLLFFIALVWSIEKILIRIISLNFHAVAYADRLSQNGFALATIDRLKNYRPKSRKRNNVTHSGFNTPSAFRSSTFGGVGDGGGGGGGYFASPQMRSRANTPPFGSSSGGGNNGSPSPAAMLSPPIPGAPEPTHHSLWSRLPIPHSFRGAHEQHLQYNPSAAAQNTAIPLQVAPQHFMPDRRAPLPPGAAAHPTGISAAERGQSVPGSAETSVPGTPSTPHGLNSSANSQSKANSKKNRKKGKKLHLFGKKAATAQEIARQAMVDPLKTLNNPDIVGKGLGLDFGGAGDAKKLARDLFYAFRADPSRNYLVTSDFYPAFKSEHEAEAAFAVFDKDGNGDLSRPEIRATILAAYKERKFLARSLQDVSEAVSTLDRLFQVASLIILALIAFAIFHVDIYSNLTTAYTIAIAASFIFKSAAQNVFDSVIFLFATHPFDSGDRIFLEEQVYVVKRLGLFSTLFTKWDGTETMIANSKLGQLAITNLRRSSPQYENAFLQLSWNTSLEQLDQLESKMNNWLSKDEKRMFAPSTSVVIQSFDYMRSISVTLPMGHRTNWQDWGERWNRRTAFHAALLHYCKELDIGFVNSTQPIEYWQEDLEQAPLQDDDNDPDDLRSPLSPLDGENQIPTVAPLQPVMGFLPPEGSTMRRRKGHSKSRNMASSGI